MTEIIEPANNNIKTVAINTLHMLRDIKENMNIKRKEIKNGTSKNKKYGAPVWLSHLNI